MSLLEGLLAPQPSETLESILLRASRLTSTSVAEVKRHWLPGAALPRGRNALGSVMAVGKMLDMPAELVARRHSLAPISQGITFSKDQETQSLARGGSLLVAAKRKRICQACIAEDVRWHGFSYYRVHHQITGVQTCHKHQQSLTELDDRAESSLPSDPDFPELFSSDCPDFHDSPICLRYQEVVMGLLEQHTQVSGKALGASLRALLGEFSSEAQPRTTLIDLLKLRSLADIAFVDHVLKAASTRAQANPRNNLALALCGAEISPLVYVIATLLVTQDAHTALNVLTGRLVCGINIPRKARVAEQDFRAAYVDAGGSYRKVEKALDINRSTVNERLENLRLPCSSPRNRKLFESLAAISDGMSFQQATAAHDAHPEELQALLIALCEDRIRALARARVAAIAE